MGREWNEIAENINANLVRIENALATIVETITQVRRPPEETDDRIGDMIDRPSPLCPICGNRLVEEVSFERYVCDQCYAMYKKRDTDASENGDE